MPRRPPGAVTRTSTVPAARAIPDGVRATSSPAASVRPSDGPSTTRTAAPASGRPVRPSFAHVTIRASRAPTIAATSVTCRIAWLTWVSRSSRRYQPLPRATGILRRCSQSTPTNDARPAKTILRPPVAIVGRASVPAHSGLSSMLPSARSAAASLPSP